MTSLTTTYQDMPKDVRERLSRFVAQLKKSFGDDILGIILYGSVARGEYIEGRSNINVLLLMARVDLVMLQECARMQRSWSQENIVTPLFFTEGELRVAADLFPLEFLEMRDQHIVLEGRNPFPRLQINESHLALLCEQEIQGNLLRLRQQFVEGRGRPEAIQTILPISLTALLPCLRGLYRILRKTVSYDSETVLKQLKENLQVEPMVFEEVLTMKRGLGSPGTIELPRLFERYVASLESVGLRIQEMKSTGEL